MSKWKKKETVEEVQVEEPKKKEKKPITGIKEIDLVLHNLNNIFQKDLFTVGPRFVTAECIPTGSLSLDTALGIGGYPTDRIIEIFGPEGAGKTSLALQLASMYAKKFGYGRKILFVDLERTTGMDLVAGMGLDPKKVLFSYPDSAEEALQITKDLIATGVIGLVIFDSVDAAQTEADLKRNVSEKGVGELPRKMSFTLRSISKLCPDKKACCIFVNQIRMNIGKMYGNPEVTSGGNALPYYASLRLRVQSKPHEELMGALAMKVKIYKNKLAGLLRSEAEFPFIPGKGIMENEDVLNYARDSGVIRYAGPSVIVKFDDEETTLCSGGKNGAREYISSNPDFYKRLREYCLSHISIPAGNGDSRESSSSSEQ